LVIRSQLPDIACVHSTRGIIVRLTRLTETSLIVHWFSRDYGLVKTVAKGARRPKSPFAGKLDLFFGGELSYTPARRGDLDSLREVAITDWRQGLRKNYATTLLAAYFCQLLEAAVEPRHPEPALHDLLKRALDHLDAAAPGLRALHHFETELARLLGISEDPRRAESALRDALGSLPANRRELIARLAPPEDFRSSSAESV
jgi:DNA repair protein RecO (recombination protein O)